VRAFLKKPFELEKIQRVLVRGPNWVGDAVLCTPALANLRKALLHAKISLLVKPWVGGLLEGNPHIDDIILYEDRHKGPWGKLRLAAELRVRSFELAILFPNSFESALVAFLAGIPHRVGYETDGRGILLTVRVDRDRELLRRHQAEYYVNLLQAVGLDRGERDLVVIVSQKEEAEAIQILLGEGVGEDDVIVGLNPGSVYGSAKRWPADRYATLADQLSRAGARVLLLGSSKEADILARVQSLMQSKAVNLAGKTSLKLLAAILDRCRVLVTNDTGAMHVAAAVGTPVVAIFGPTDPRVTSPLGKFHQILRHPPSCAPCLLRECPIDHRCMTAISVEEVLAAAQPYLSLAPRSQSLAPAVFLDRDGTINEEVQYLSRPEEVRLLPGAADALRLLKEHGFKRIIVSNQSGVARGYFSEKEVAEVHTRLLALLANEKSGVEGIYHCSHGPEEGCSCRKPKSGLVKKAEREHHLDLSRSYVVGDKVSDVALARNLGLKAVLVLTGYGKQALQELREGEVIPDHVAEDLCEAAHWIVEGSVEREYGWQKLQ